MNQNINHKKPKQPVMTNAHCQPHALTMNGTVKGAVMAPMFVPELKIPVAKALSFLGNHSATVFTAAGKFPASLNPRTERAVIKPVTVRTKACPTDARLQVINARAYPVLVPILS